MAIVTTLTTISRRMVVTVVTLLLVGSITTMWCTTTLVTDAFVLRSSRPLCTTRSSTPDPTTTTTTTTGCFLASPTSSISSSSSPPTAAAITTALPLASSARAILPSNNPSNNYAQRLSPSSSSSLHETRVEGASSASSASSSFLASFSNDQTSILSVGLWCILDILLRRIFQRLQIAQKFPSSLGGCGVILTLLLLLEQQHRPTTTPTHRPPSSSLLLYQLLSPGASVLATWLPVFFIPSLVTLPLIGVDSLGGLAEIAKGLAVLVGGFYFTLLTTAGAVVAVGTWRAGKTTTTTSTDDDDEDNEEPQKAVDQDNRTGGEDGVVVATTAMPAVPTVPFSAELLKRLRIVAIFSGLAALEGASPMFTVTLAKLLTHFQTPILTVLLGSTTLAGFVFGARLPKRVTKRLHPLMTTLAIIWTVLGLFAKCTGRTFASVLSTYRMGRGFHGLNGTGAGDILLFLLGPAVMSLSISMYDKRELIRTNCVQILAAIATSALGGLFGTAMAVRLLGLASADLRVALLSRNITSPLALAIAGLLGASASTMSLAVSIVVVTGVFGANFGASILSRAGIHDPVARGLGMGAAAHGLGTAAIVDEPEAFPFAAIAMALTATACTCLCSVPIVKNVLLRIALHGV